MTQFAVCDRNDKDRPYPVIDRFDTRADAEKFGAEWSADNDGTPFTIEELPSMSEVFDFFRQEYRRELLENLTEAAKDGELDKVVDATGCIDGGLLTCVDETAYGLTRTYFHEADFEPVGFHQAFQEEASCLYDSVDYGAIINQARAAV